MRGDFTGHENAENCFALRQVWWAWGDSLCCVNSAFRVFLRRFC